MKKHTNQYIQTLNCEVFPRTRLDLPEPPPPPKFGVFVSNTIYTCGLKVMLHFMKGKSIYINRIRIYIGYVRSKYLHHMYKRY